MTTEPARPASSPSNSSTKALLGMLVIGIVIGTLSS